MELTEAVELLEWLQQERLKDKARLDALEATLGQQQARIDAQNQRLQEWETLRADMHEQLAQVPALENDIGRWRQELSRRISDVDAAYREALQQLETAQDPERVLTALHEVQERLSHLETIAGQDKDQLAVLVQAREDLGKRVTLLGNQLDGLVTDSRTTTDKVTTLGKAHETLAHHVTQLGSEVQPLSTQQQQLLEKVERVDTRQDQALAHITEQRERLQTLENNTPAVAHQLDVLSDAQQDIADHLAGLRRRVDSFATQIQDGSEQIERMEGSHDSLAGELKQQHQRISQTEQRTQGLSERLETIGTRQGELAGQLSEQAKLTTSLQQADGALAERIESASHRTQVYQERLDRAEQHIHTLEQALAETQQGIAAEELRHNQVLPRIAALETSRDALFNDIESIQRTIQITDTANTSLRDQLGAAAQKLGTLEQALSSQLDQVEGMRNTQTTSIAQLSRLGQGLEALETSLRDLAEARALTEERAQTLQQTITLAQQRIETLQASLGEHGERLETLEQIPPQLRAKLSQANAQQQETAQQVREHAGLIDRLQTQHQQDTTALRQVHERLRQAQQKLGQDVHLEHEQQRQRLNTWADEMGEWEKHVASWNALIHRFGEENRRIQQYLSDLEATEKRLLQDNEQRAALQRVTETRRTKELDEWRGEIEKKWDHFLADQQFYRGKQSELDGGQNERLDSLDAWQQRCIAELEGLHRALTQHRDERNALIRELWQTSARMAEVRIAELQQLVDTVQAQDEIGGATT